MHENRFNEYRIPSGMLIVFLEKALTLIHMETHLDDVSTRKLLDYASLWCLLPRFVRGLSQRLMPLVLSKGGRTRSMRPFS